MSTEEPTNREIMITLKGFRELVETRLENIEDHLKTLNGQVAKNTLFAQKGSVYLSILGIIGIAVIGLIIENIFI